MKINIHKLLTTLLVTNHSCGVAGGQHNIKVSQLKDDEDVFMLQHEMLFLLCKQSFAQKDKTMTKTIEIKDEITF